MTLITIYVDDILVDSRNVDEINSLGLYHSENFEMKHLGEVTYCLGIEFSRRNGQIVMLQWKNIDDVLKRFGMSFLNAVNRLDCNTKLKKSKEPAAEDEQ